MILLTVLTSGQVFSIDYTLGVLYFETSPGGSPGLSSTDKQALATALNEMMIADLSRLSILTLVERERLNKIIEEQKTCPHRDGG